MKTDYKDIAIIAINGRFPKANNVAQFWDHIQQGEDCLTHFTDEQLASAGIPDSLYNSKHYIKSRGILKNIDLFDADYFGLSSQVASLMDPQQRLLLECAAEVLVMTNYDIRRPNPIGVYVGASEPSYQLCNLNKNQNLLNSTSNFQLKINNSFHATATRLSFQLNLTGPSMSIATGCSTSLVAVIMACQALQQHCCDMALAGGVTIKIPQISGYEYREGHILSSDGVCRPFDETASGTVLSNGVGLVALKRLEDAKKDKNTILATIRGFAINNDGRQKMAFTAPSVDAQYQCMQNTLANAQIYPNQVGYIETHGTGTHLGDPIEFEAIKKTYSTITATQPCILGAVKANIGHTDTASGIIGLIKTVLVVNQGIKPMVAHFRTPNPELQVEQSRFVIPTETQSWNEPIRIAAVNSLGIGGTNAHIILESSSKSTQFNTDFMVPPKLFKKKRHWVEPDITSHLPTVDTNFVEKPPLHYVTQWVATSNTCQCSNDTTDPTAQRIWIFLLPNKSHKTYLEPLANMTKDYIYLYLNNEFEQIHSNEFYLDIQQTPHIEQLLTLLPFQLDAVTDFVHLFPDAATTISANDSYNKYNTINQVIRYLLRQTKQTVQYHVITPFMNYITCSDKVNKVLRITLGPLLCTYQEHPHIQPHIIDIPLDLSHRTQLQHELLYPTKTLHVAFRNTIRFTPIYNATQLPATTTGCAFKLKGTYVLVGGLGKIGLILAKELASHYQANLILLTRRQTHELSLATHATLSKLSECASSVNVITCDATDFATLKKTFEELIKNHGNIDGVLHLAAELTHAKTPIQEMRKAIFLEQYHAKIAVLHNLHRLTESNTLPFIAAFSSLATVLGGLGLSAYSSINALMEAEVHYYNQSSDTHWYSLAWDALSVSTKISDQHFAYQLSSLDMFNSLSEMLTNRIYQHTFISKRNLLNPNELRIISKTNKLNQPKATAAISTQSLKDTLLNLVQKHLEKPSITVNDDFYQHGGDSLQAVDLLANINQLLNIELPYSTVTPPLTVNQLLTDIQLKQTHITPTFKLLKTHSSSNISLLLPPISGALFCYNNLIKKLKLPSQLLGATDPGLMQMNCSINSIPELATFYLDLFNLNNSQSCTLLIGYSYGALLAFELAYQLTQAKTPVTGIIMIDGWATFDTHLRDKSRFEKIIQSQCLYLKQIFMEYNLDPTQWQQLIWSRMNLAFQYQPSYKLKIPTLLLKANTLLPEYQNIAHPHNHWDRYIDNTLHCQLCPGDHYSLLTQPHDQSVAQAINEWCSQLFNTKTEV